MAVAQEVENYYFYSTIPGGDGGLPYSLIVAIGSPTSSLSTGFMVNKETVLFVDNVPQPMSAIHSVDTGRRVDVDTDGKFATIIRILRD